METRWLYRTSETLAELREVSKGVCVIPFGCVEKHGLHLPLGQDIIEASVVAYMASQIEPVCVFPDHIFGDVPCWEVGNIPNGFVTLSWELQLQLMQELCENISRNGFKKILVFNGHGGNVPLLDAFQRSLCNIKHDYLFVHYMLDLPAPHGMAEYLIENGRGSIPEINTEDEDLILKYHEEKMVVGHACFGETAHMMGICPEAVHLDRLGIEDGKRRPLTKYLSDVGLNIRDGGYDIMYPNCFAGDDPYGCNERIGKASLRFSAERAARAYKVYKEDENLMKWEANNMR